MSSYFVVTLYIRFKSAQRLNINRYLFQSEHFFPGCNLQAVSKDHQTPLCLASQKGNEEVVRYLIKALPKPLSFKILSAIPIHAAAKQGHAHVLKLLAENGCDINQVIFMYVCN